MFLADRSHIALIDRDEPVLLAWPRPGNPGGLVRFDNAIDWRDFVDYLGIDARIPDIVRARFARAQTLYKLGQGDPFEGLPTGGLLELVRDLINFAFCKYIAEAASVDALPASSGQG